METIQKKHLKTYLATVLACLGMTLSGFGQGHSHIVNSSGGTVVIDSNVHEWSIAEMAMVSTLTSSELVLTQGLLQPFQTSLSINNPSGLTSELFVSPNPAEETVNFRITNSNGAKVDYRLMNIIGQVILLGQVANQSETINQSIDISRLATGTYLLNVSITQGNNHHNQTIKVIKK